MLLLQLFWRLSCIIYPCFNAVVILVFYIAVLGATQLTSSASRVLRKFNTSFYAHFQNQ